MMPPPTTTMSAWLGNVGSDVDNARHKMLLLLAWAQQNLEDDSLSDSAICNCPAMPINCKVTLCETRRQATNARGA